MNIVLLYPRWTLEYGIFNYFAKAASVWPPLNLAYLAALAEKMGHTVHIIDAEAENLSVSKIISRIEDVQPVDLIGITATTPFFHTAVNVAKTLKLKFQVPIAIGGHHITALKEEAFYPCFDFAFIGESELSWTDFLKRLHERESVEKVKGILFRKNDKIIFSGTSTRIENVDTLPFPSRRLLKSDLYTIGTIEGRKKFTTIYTTWGCPFRCIFCCTGAFVGKKLRKRNPFFVVEEMKQVIQDHNIKHFMFLDDTLTIDRKHILEICKLIKSNNLQITFEGSTRANLVDEELIIQLKEAGLVRLSFGLESVDEQIRKVMKKDVSLNSYIEANKITNKYNIETLNSCMLGLPYETHETLEKTLDFLDKYKEIKQANISIAVPYPGTELYKMAKNKEHGLSLLTEDYSKYRRYNIAVMNVGSLSSKDLIEMQNYAFLSIYSAYWRLKPMIKKFQKKVLFLMMIRFIKYIFCLLKRSNNVTWRVFKIKK